MIQKIFQKQLMMRKVLYALTPIFLFSIYLYSWRAIVHTALVFAAGIATEYFYNKRINKKVSEAVLVTCALYALSLPGNSPFLISMIGIIFGVLFGKLIFGGFGRNVFNPAITGRLFVYITFPTVFNHFAKPGVDGLASATPLTLFRNGESVSTLNLFIGNHLGSIGETSSLLILLGGGYLIYTKTANWKSITGTFVAYFVLQSALYFGGVANAISPINGIFAGSFMFVLMFMVTDPVSAPKQSKSLFVYGALIGISIALIRTFSLFPEGTSFAILLGNTFAPWLDEIFKKKKKQVKGAK